MNRGAITQMLLNREKIKDIWGIPLEDYYFFDFFLYSGYFVLFFLNVFNSLFYIFAVIKNSLGFFLGILISGILFILPESILIIMILLQKIYFRFLSDKKLIKGRRSTSKIPLMQVGTIYLIFLIHLLDLNFLIMDLIILGLISYPLIFGVIEFMNLTKNLYNTQEERFVDAVTTQESMWIASFSSFIGFFIGINPIFFLLLIYIKFPIKYFFFNRKKFRDFYDNFENYSGKIRIIHYITATVGISLSTIAYLFIF